MMIVGPSDAELPALWHRGVDRFAVKVRFEVVERQIGHGLARLARRATNMRCQNDVRNGAQGLWHIRLVFKYI